jgi:hypothetical protein
MRFAPLVFLLLISAVYLAQAQAPTCQQACASGYASFRQWCMSRGPTAKCTSLMNAPRQFNPQACLRFCTE